MIFNVKKYFYMEDHPTNRKWFITIVIIHFPWRIHGAAIYGNMDPINMSPMLAYIYIPYMDPMGLTSFIDGIIPEKKGTYGAFRVKSSSSTQRPAWLG